MSPRVVGNNINCCVIFLYLLENLSI